SKYAKAGVQILGTLQWGRRVHSAKRSLGHAHGRGQLPASMGSPSSLGEETARRYRRISEPKCFNGVAEFTRRRGRPLMSDRYSAAWLHWGGRVHSAKSGPWGRLRHLYRGLQWGRRVHSAKSCHPSKLVPGESGEASMGSPSSLGEEPHARLYCSPAHSRGFNGVAEFTRRSGAARTF